MYMKKIVVIAAAALVMVGCNPLRVVLDNVRQGNREVLTSTKKIASTRLSGNVSVALGARFNEKDTVMAVLAVSTADTDHSVFKKDGQMMFRLTDGTTVTLKNIYENEFEDKSETRVTNTPRTDFGYAYTYSPWTDGFYVVPYEINTMVTQVHNYKEKNSYALYLISKPELDGIISKGISKIRIETESEDVDSDDYQALTQLFRDMYNCLMPVVRLNKDNYRF